MLIIICNAKQKTDWVFVHVRQILWSALQEKHSVPQSLMTCSRPLLWFENIFKWTVEDITADVSLSLSYEEKKIILCALDDFVMWTVWNSFLHSVCCFFGWPVFCYRCIFFVILRCFYFGFPHNGDLCWCCNAWNKLGFKIITALKKYLGAAEWMLISFVYYCKINPFRFVDDHPVRIYFELTCGWLHVILLITQLLTKWKK